MQAAQVQLVQEQMALVVAVLVSQVMVQTLLVLRAALVGLAVEAGLQAAQAAQAAQEYFTFSTREQL